MPDTGGMLTRDMLPPPPVHRLPDVVPAVRPAMSVGAGGATPLNTTGWVGLRTAAGGQRGYVGQDTMDPATHIRPMRPMAGSSVGFDRMHEEQAAAAAAQQGNRVPKSGGRRTRRAAAATPAQASRAKSPTAHNAPIGSPATTRRPPKGRRSR
jgi:hypothetical protein